MRSGWRFLVLVLLVLSAASASAAPSTLTLGQSLIALNGPWKFRTGDDPRWASPDADDRGWETVDLTPAPGAHDNDVGLKNWVSGWSARGHRGYVGFAWYRMTVRVDDPGSDALWLVGPADLDSAYQLFFNGHLIGGIGDFSRSPPTVTSIGPRLFALPRRLWDVRDGHWTGVVAVRVVLERGALTRTPSAGGIHIAPLLGHEDAARDRYGQQWLQLVEGYAVDAVEPVAFLLLAIMALSLMPFDPKDRFYPWLAAALVLLAAARANQPLYFLAQIETMRAFGFWRVVVIDGLTFAAWTMAWRAAFRQQSSHWVAVAAAGLAALYMIARLLTLAMFFPDMPHAVAAILANVLQLTRLGFLSLFIYLAVRGVMDRVPWLAQLAFLSVSVGLFAPELSAIGVPGIWFPFGVGVSRTEYAYAVFVVAMFFYLLQRLWAYAPTARRNGNST
ncbi:MAG TPA: hypothetical protein VKB71_06885 [Rhizomicrobium sp.]|nr:hypothetical protein [Rhizomicrobium sp.]